MGSIGPSPRALPAGVGSGTFIFGYGSLAHTPGFSYRSRVEGYITGYRRVFYQGSTDHRGTPQAPGRTVTLVPDASARTWGVAFELEGTDAEVADAVKYLEWREKQYDQRELVDVYSKYGQVLVKGALCYIATDNRVTNRNWLGAAPLPAIAQQIASSVGPSGPNCDYLYRLAATMRSIPGAAEDDPDLFWLEAEVRRLVEEQGGPPVLAACRGGEEAGGVAAVAVVDESPHRQRHEQQQRRHREQQHQEQRRDGKGHATALTLEADARAEMPAAVNVDVQ